MDMIWRPIEGFVNGCGCNMVNRPWSTRHRRQAAVREHRSFSSVVARTNKVRTECVCRRKFLRDLEIDLKTPRALNLSEFDTFNFESFLLSRVRVIRLTQSEFPCVSFASKHSSFHLRLLARQSKNGASTVHGPMTRRQKVAESSLHKNPTRPRYGTG
jgi:hypothetical protein